MGDHWLYVELSYATFALTVQNGRIADAPPIARWTIGKRAETVAAYYRQRGTVTVQLPELS